MFLKPKEEVINNTDNKIIDNLRALSIDMINEAKSGHPGISLSMAPVIYTLYNNHLKINPSDPNWVNRDRFILSAGHASSLLYATLYMAGYDISLDDLKNFRKLDSITPGHPELGTPGVDMSTGMLGQGIASAVGISMAEEYLHEYYKKKDNNLINYYTYVLCSDGDLMEGVSYEALSLAGHLKLNKLIVLYDCNNICLDGKISNTNSTDIYKYFNSLNWNVISVDSENINAIDEALTKAKTSLLPVLILVNSTIGKYSKWEGTNKVHGTPLEEDDIKNIKEKLNLHDIAFRVSKEAQDTFRENIKSRCEKEYTKWNELLEKQDENTKVELDKIKNHNLTLDNLDITFDQTEIDSNIRNSSSKILNAFANINPLFIGGSSDVSSSVKTNIEDSEIYSRENRLARNICYGVREHAMGAIMNGISLAGIRNFGSTYLAFSDYLKPAIRMACQMNLANIYIFSHDSISVGEDGPTHQPIEQLISLRATPNMTVFRPNDINEIIGTYKVVAKLNSPASIILGRNDTTVKENTSITDVSKGAYIVKKENKNISAIILSSGEELDLALEVSDVLNQKGYDIRVVSVVSLELFKKQKQEYKEKIIPFGVKVFVIELSSSYSWYEFVYNDKYLITLDEFGKSGSKDQVLEKFGFTTSKIVEKIENLLK